jgi:hypothetical protein
VPVLRVFGFDGYVELFEFTYFLFKLDYETDFGGDAEVANTEEAYCFEEGESVQFLLVAADRDEVFKLEGCDLHDVAYV